MKTIKACLGFLLFLSLFVPVHYSLAELEALTAENIISALDAMNEVGGSFSDPTCDNPDSEDYGQTATRSRDEDLCDPGHECRWCLRTWPNYPIRCNVCPPVTPVAPSGWCYTCKWQDCGSAINLQTCYECCGHWTRPGTSQDTKCRQMCVRTQDS